MSQFILGSEHWPPMPAVHRDFLHVAIPKLTADPRVAGLAAGGSFAAARLDTYSDLDLLVVSDADTGRDVAREGPALAAGLGPLLSAFRGDHVGELRLLICLYGPPLLHVDLKFLTTEELADRVEDPVVLWDRHGEVRRGLARGVAAYPQPDPQWIEDRFWVWVHYTVTKIARGELFEAIDAVGFIRRRVLAPLILVDAGMRPDGVRHVEDVAPSLVARLTSTLSAHDRTSCTQALEATIALYTDLRGRRGPSVLVRRGDAERAATTFLAEQLRR